MTEHLDVLVIGAGISGISAGYHLQKRCPNKTYAILEGRAQLGGTWDLFRYPGIRSDSDMYTLGFAFKPWTAAKAIANGPDIITYLQETVAEFGIDRHIRYQQRVSSASWSSETQRWTLEVICDGQSEPVLMTCNFLLGCSGYYNYDAGYTPKFEGVEQFRGQVVHPQFWPDDLDYKDKQVVVIGSGATAVTLLPSLAEQAAHVTMLQRSPTYIASIPSVDPFIKFLRRGLSERFVHPIARWKNILYGRYLFWYLKKFPLKAKNFLINEVRTAIGDNCDVDTHFTPSYKPWDQRLCIVPDGDMFEAIKSGDASVVTDHIDCFTETGLKLKSGKTLDADIIITATGLDMRIGGGIEITIDGKAVRQRDLWTYKGMMLSDIPNHAFAIGYSNASWTLKVDLTCDYVCRLLNYMDKNNFKQCTPKVQGATLEEEPLMNLNSGYIERAKEHLPKQASIKPWKLHQNYLLDKIILGYSKINDSTMVFK